MFGTGVRVGVPRENIGGLADSVESPRYATVAGLALYAASRAAIGAGVTAGRKMQLTGPGMDKLVSRVKTWLQDFF